jgi:hypothetical protein
VLSEVFALRHVLTHSGGELRTADDVGLFAGSAASLGIGDRVVLSSTTVEEHLHLLNTAVHPT